MRRAGGAADSVTSKLRNIAVASKVGDTGAKVVIFTPKTAREHGIKGTLQHNTMKLSTANGTISPKYSIEADVPVLMVTPLKVKRTAHIRMRGIVVPECAHDLIPIAAMAKTHGLALHVAAWTGEAHLLVCNKRIGPLGSTLPLMNMGVLVFPPPPDDANYQYNAAPVNTTDASSTDKEHAMPVTRGHAGATAKVTEQIHHCRCIHRSEYVTRNLYRCVDDVPKALCDRVGLPTTPCDGCLRGSMMKNHPVPPGSHVPTATHAGQWVSGDVYTVQVGYRWGGQRKIFQLYDHYSHRNFPFLIRNESECPQKLREFFSQCRVDGVKVSNLNLDNAKIFVNEGVLFETCKKVCKEAMFDGMPVRVTSCCPYTPRQNGTIEHQFDVCSTDVRRCMSDALAPANLYWDSWQHVCFVQARLPLKGAPDECGMSRWNGTKPHFAQVVRVWGCVGYVKDFHSPSKMHDQGIICMHLGRCSSQPGWRMLDLSTGRIYDTCHVDYSSRAAFEVSPSTVTGASRWCRLLAVITTRRRRSRRGRCRPRRPTTRRLALPAQTKGGNLPTAVPQRRSPRRAAARATAATAAVSPTRCRGASHVQRQDATKPAAREPARSRLPLRTAITSSTFAAASCATATSSRSWRSSATAVFASTYVSTRKRTTCLTTA